VLAIEDGPTVTHGGMRYGAATLAAQQLGAVLVDPRSFAVGEIAATYKAYPELGPLLPAMGYGVEQLNDLQKTVDAAGAHGVEAIAIGTPIDLARLIRISTPCTRVRYELELAGGRTLLEVLRPLLQ
jgi:predicted GTPase